MTAMTISISINLDEGDAPPAWFLQALREKPTVPAPSVTKQHDDATAADVSSRLLSRRLRFEEGWPSEAVHEAMTQLAASNNIDQLRVIEAASLSGGFVARDEALTLIGRNPDARGVLNNFMRRTNQISDELREAGIIAQDARSLLYPESPEAGVGWTRITGFRVPFQVNDEPAD
jgi:hypothetical protein